jgi:protein TonB
MDRSGKVLSYARARSAGFDMLDEEVLAMIRRAQPLPALSPEVKDPTVEIVVPVRFMLRRRRLQMRIICIKTRNAAAERAVTAHEDER